MPLYEFLSWSIRYKSVKTKHITRTSLCKASAGLQQKGSLLWVCAAVEGRRLGLPRDPIHGRSEHAAPMQFPICDVCALPRKMRAVSVIVIPGRFSGLRYGPHILLGCALCKSVICQSGVAADLPFLPAGDIFQRVMVRSPRIEIRYCTQCRWLLRAAWMAQELLTTFQDELGEVALLPGTGGVFEVRLGTEVIWSRAEQGRFPDIKELKQLVRDRIAPARDLGHSEIRGQ